jgi:hypothetical protein
VTLVAVELKEGHAFQAVLEKLLARVRPGIKPESVAGAQLFQLGEFSIERMRASTPTFALTDRYLIYSDSRVMLDKVCLSIAGSGEASLRDNSVYKQVSELVKKQLGDSEPVMVTYSRPDESLLMFYEMANDPQNRKWLDEISQNNAFFMALNEALRDNPLPPFSVIARHLAPTGGFVYDEPTGFHYMAFSLQPPSSKEK